MDEPDLSLFEVELHFRGELQTGQPEGAELPSTRGMRFSVRSSIIGFVVLVSKIRANGLFSAIRLAETEVRHIVLSSGIDLRTIRLEQLLARRTQSEVPRGGDPGVGD